MSINIEIYLYGQQENLQESVYDPDGGQVRRLRYVKINGMKYYQDNVNYTWFSILNGKKVPLTTGLEESKIGKEGVKYYKDAYDFTNWVESTLGSLSPQDKVGDGNGVISDVESEIFNNVQGNIFEGKNSSGSGVSIEDPNSNFNQHRLAVIRYCIQRNLSIAIANYNNYFEVTDNSNPEFHMPKLQENEWDNIVNNVSIMSFLQGLSIGGKLYNGYSIVTNNRTNEVVDENSIYILDNNNTYHRPNHKDLNPNGTYTGVFNLDFEIKSSIDDSNNRSNVIPAIGYKGGSGPFVYGCYSCIVNQSNVDAPENFYEYMANKRWKFSLGVFYCIRKITI